MASWTALAPPTTAAMAIFLMLCSLPVLSKPVITDPDTCVDRLPNQKCCPPRSNAAIVDFQLPPQTTPLRVRRRAHALTAEDAQKYEKAVGMMRALPEDHPWNFVQQSNVHCAYCNGGHLHLGTNMTIEIHSSWHFFTWHRAYLYFFERILGKLVNDSSFALPFWNWDNRDGMSIPAIYRDSASALFNPTRYPRALNVTNVGGCPGDGTPESIATQKLCNLQAMHRQFVAASSSTFVFFGSPLRAGGPNYPGGGPLESIPHSPVHISTGSDMSLITKSGLDPLFHVHHSNVDRLWAIWDEIPANYSKVIDDADFLDASFLFWDENMQRVRIKVRDVVDTRKLGYVYEDVPLQWMNIETTVEAVGGLGKQARFEGSGVGEVVFPVRLSYEVKIRVARAAVAVAEMLVVSGIELDGRDYVWFKVYLSRVRGGGRVEAGCFIHMERRGDEKFGILTQLRLGITEFMNKIGAAGDDQILVTLSPTIGGEKVTVGGVSII